MCQLPRFLHLPQCTRVLVFLSDIRVLSLKPSWKSKAFHTAPRRTAPVRIVDIISLHLQVLAVVTTACRPLKCSTARRDAVFANESHIDICSAVEELAIRIPSLWDLVHYSGQPQWWNIVQLADSCILCLWSCCIDPSHERAGWRSAAKLVLISFIMKGAGNSSCVVLEDVADLLLTRSCWSSQESDFQEQEGSLELIPDRPAS